MPGARQIAQPLELVPVPVVPEPLPDHASLRWWCPVPDARQIASSLRW
jgi:hypothetical protein